MKRGLVIGLLAIAFSFTSIYSNHPEVIDLELTGYTTSTTNDVSCGNGVCDPDCTKEEDLDCEAIPENEQQTQQEALEKPTSAKTDVIKETSKTALYSLFLVVIILGVILLFHHSKKR